MSDYKWYKDSFLSKITLWEDGFVGFWKERFVVRFSIQFAEKIWTNLQQYYENQNLKRLTYGQIYNIIVTIEIQLYTNFKL